MELRIIRYMNLKLEFLKKSRIEVFVPWSDPYGRSPNI